MTNFMSDMRNGFFNFSAGADKIVFKQQTMTTPRDKTLF